MDFLTAGQRLCSVYAMVSWIQSSLLAFSTSLHATSPQLAKQISTQLNRSQDIHGQHYNISPPPPYKPPPMNAIALLQFLSGLVVDAFGPAHQKFWATFILVISLANIALVIATVYWFLPLTFFDSNARFRGGGSQKPAPQPLNKSPTPSNSGGIPPSPTTLSQGSQSSSSLAPKIPPLPNSPSLTQSFNPQESFGQNATGEEILNSYHLPRPLPVWLNSNYAKHIVKGNFMTLSARPKTVDPGEWIAHQGESAAMRQAH